MTNKYNRFKVNPEKIFDCYCEVSFKIRTESNGNVIKRPWIKRRFPDTYKSKETLESVPKFAYPCNNLVINTVTQFSFVLTNSESNWTFGYCRISPTTDTCIVLLSQLPWHETFFKIIAHIGTIYHQQDRQLELLNFLKALYQTKIPDEPSLINTTHSNASLNSLVVQFKTSPQDIEDKKLTFEIVDNNNSLATIPQDRNLTEYYNAISVENMITLFASAINERHILVVSKRLDRLSACVQAINTLLYPMIWQHIFIPVLPSDLLAYLQAPMPFLIGVPEPTFKSLRLDELGEIVLLMADDDVVRSPHEDVKNLPPGIANSIRSDLKNTVALGDSVSQAFLRALVMLIGGYREALEFNDGQKITFNHERFIATRQPTFQAFLKKMLELQMFRQFIEGRLEMLNAGQGFNDDFEFGVNLYEENNRRVNIQYQDWINSISSMKKTSGVLLKSINPSLRLVYRGIKDKSKQAYKDWKVKLNDANNGNNNNNNNLDNQSSTSHQSSFQAPSFFYSRMS